MVAALHIREKGGSAKRKVMVVDIMVPSLCVIRSDTMFDSDSDTACFFYVR